MIGLGYYVGPEIVGQIVLSPQILPGLCERNWSHEVLKFVVKFNYLRAYMSIFIVPQRNSNI